MTFKSKDRDADVRLIITTWKSQARRERQEGILKRDISDQDFFCEMENGHVSKRFLMSDDCDFGGGGGGSDRAVFVKT